MWQCDVMDHVCVRLWMGEWMGGWGVAHLPLRAAQGRFSNDGAKYYAAEIVLAFSHLHSYAVVYARASVCIPRMARPWDMCVCPMSAGTAT